MEKAFPVIFALAAGVIAIIFTAGIVQNYRQDKANTECLSRGFTKAILTLDGTFCKKYGDGANEIVIQVK